VACGQDLDDFGADVVAGLAVLVAGVAEADDEQVGRRPRPGTASEQSG
jgi:hypothetical protein